MTRTLFSLVAAGLLASAVAHAQSPSITVKQGTSITYRVKGSTDMTQSMMGQEMTVNLSNDGNLILASKKVADDRLDWTSQLKNVKVKVKSPMPMGKGDTTITTRPKPFVTDRTGRVLEGELEAVGSAQILQGGLQQFFAPIINRNLQAGETWETDRTDTTVNMGVSIITRTRLRYTYDGKVDTLKQKAVRLRVEIVEMTLSGGGTVPQAGEAKIDGEGSGTSTLYYSERDGLLLAATQDNTSTMRMELSAASMTIPITYKLHSTVVRQ